MQFASRSGQKEIVLCPCRNTLKIAKQMINIDLLWKKETFAGHFVDFPDMAQPYAKLASRQDPYEEILAIPYRYDRV
jgi:hypothetical protein